jgi:predicted kinase
MFELVARPLRPPVEDYIAAEHETTGDVAFGREDLKSLSLCVLVLKNGYIVVGDASCAKTVDIDREKGRKIARRKAVQRLYVLQEHLATREQP